MFFYPHFEIMSARTWACLVIFCIQYMIGINNTSKSDSWSTLLRAKELSASESFQARYRSLSPNRASSPRRFPIPERAPSPHRASSPFRQTAFCLSARTSLRLSTDSQRRFYDRLAEPRTLSPPHVRRQRIANRELAFQKGQKESHHPSPGLTTACQTMPTKRWSSAVQRSPTPPSEPRNRISNRALPAHNGQKELLRSSLGISTTNIPTPTKRWSSATQQSPSPPSARRHRIPIRALPTQNIHKESLRPYLGTRTTIVATFQRTPTKRLPRNQWVTPVLNRTSIKARYGAQGAATIGWIGRF